MRGWSLGGSKPPPQKIFAFFTVKNMQVHASLGDFSVCLEMRSPVSSSQVLAPQFPIVYIPIGTVIIRTQRHRLGKASYK